MKQPRLKRTRRGRGRALLDLTMTPSGMTLRKARRRTIARRVKASRANSHAADAAAGPRTPRKQAQPKPTKSSLLQPPREPRRERRSTDPRHTEAREAARRVAAKAAMNGRRRQDR